MHLARKRHQHLGFHAFSRIMPRDMMYAGIPRATLTMRESCRQEHAGADGACAGRDDGAAARGGSHGWRADTLPGAGRGRCIQHHPRPDSRLGDHTDLLSAESAPDVTAILGEGPQFFDAPRLCLCFSVLLLHGYIHASACCCLHRYVCSSSCSCAPWL